MTISENGWSPDWRKSPKTEFFCVHCQRDIKPGQAFRHVYIIEGGAQILHPSKIASYDPQAGGIKGYWPVGMDCAKRIGMEWTMNLKEQTP